MSLYPGPTHQVAAPEKRKQDSSHYTLGPKAVPATRPPPHHHLGVHGLSLQCRASCDADALVGGTVFLRDDRFTSSTPGIW